MSYLEKVQKLFLADNEISSIIFMENITNLEYLSICKDVITKQKID